MTYIFLNFLGLKQSFKIKKLEFELFLKIWVSFWLSTCGKNQEIGYCSTISLRESIEVPFLTLKTNSNRPITKFYDSDDVNVIAVELWLAKTRPTFFIRKIIFHKKLWKQNLKMEVFAFDRIIFFLFRILSNSLIYLKTASWNYRSLYFCSIY